MSSRTQLLTRARFSAAAYRLVLLSGHVSSENGLHGQSSSLLLPVAFLLHVHPLVLLDDGCRSSASHELGQAEEEHVSINAVPLAGTDQAEGSSHQRAWCPRVNLWMVMAALRSRRYFLRANQQRMVFWMRMQAVRNLSALNFSR